MNDVNPEAMQIALLEEIQKSMSEMNRSVKEVKAELSNIRLSQEKSKFHDRYDVDLSKARSDEEIADFVKLGIEIDSIHILPVPSAMSIKLRGMTDKTIDLGVGEDYTLSGHLVTRILVTNVAGTGTAYIHVYGKPYYRLMEVK